MIAKIYRLILLLHVLLLLVACGRTQVRYVTITEKVACLEYLPEPLHPFTFTNGGEGTCPSEFDACFSPLDAASLVMNYKAMIRRIQDDWDACGPKDN